MPDVSGIELGEGAKQHKSCDPETRSPNKALSGFVRIPRSYIRE